MCRKKNTKYYQFLGKRFFLASVLFPFFISYSLAHGDLDERIQKVSEEIEARSDSTYLYVKRAKLYFEHKEYQKAIDDLQEISSRDYEDIFCDLLFAKSYQSIEAYDKALHYIDKIRDKHPNHVVALKTKGEILFKQKKYKASAIHFEKVIKYSRNKLPENYLAAAESWKSLERPKTDKKALGILQKGIDELGPLFVFQDAVLNFFLEHKAYDKALLVQKEIIKVANRKEKGYYKAAEISLLLKDTKAAKTYLELSLDAIQKLSTNKQATPAMVKLKNDINQKISTL